MSDYVITIDNMSDLPESFMEAHHLPCTYLSYWMNGKAYTHDNFLPVKEFYASMRGGSLPTTAQVNPEQCRRLMEPYLKAGMDVLHIAFSSGLSGTYNSARMAAEELREDYPERTIVVIDSLSAALGEGLLIYYAVMLKEQGKSLSEVADWVEKNKLHLVHLFTVDDLFHLYRGGRVSRTSAVVGSMLNVKPVLHVDDEGRLIPIGKVRGRKKSIMELARLMEEKLGSFAGSCDTIFIGHGDCEEDALYLKELVEKKHKLKTVMIDYVGSTIGAHSGPGTLALFFLGDKR